MATGLAVAAGVASGAPQSASRIVDRTVFCRVPGVGAPDPARYVSVQASPRLGTQAPYLSANSDGGGLTTAIRASIWTGPYLGSETGLAALSRIGCGRTSLRIPLSSKGLHGGKTTLGNRFTCKAPATILIRLRAVFRNPVTFSPSQDDRSVNVANGRIRTGSLAVATKSGLPIAFATVDDATGEASILVAKARCRAAD
jgi:hypothetical protein